MVADGNQSGPDKISTNTVSFSTGRQTPPTCADHGVAEPTTGTGQWGEGLEHEAVMQMERACLLPVSVAGASGCSRGFGGDFRCELLDLTLESSHFLQRAFREDGKLFRLAREQLFSQRGECFAHSLQLFQRLGQNGLGVDHGRSEPLKNAKPSRYLRQFTIEKPGGQKSL